MALSVIDPSVYLKIKNKLDEKLLTLGLESHAFKVGWYNSLVKSQFRLPFHDDTLAFTIISLPSMFEKTFIPFLKSNGFCGLRDPIDECMSHTFTTLEQCFLEFGCHSIQDFELLPNRRPKILAQTAAHASGAAYYYQRTDVKSQPWTPSQHIYGVCIHPKYGGWFAIRGVLILSLTLYPELPMKEAKDVLQSQQKVIELLELFNFSWQDWQYRDVVTPLERYSEKQKLYFATKPGDRLKIINSLIS